MREAKAAAGPSAPPGSIDWGEWKLWAGLFTGPVAWFADLELAYGLAPVVCRGASRGWLFLSWAVAMALVSAGLLLTRAGARERRDHRSHFVGQVATWLSVLFLLLLCASVVPRVVLGPCDL